MDELDCLVMRLNGLVDKLLADEIRASLVAPSTDMCSSSSLAAIRVVQQALDGNGGGSIGGAVYMMTPSTPSVGYGKLSNRETGTSIYGADGELELYSSIEVCDILSHSDILLILRVFILLLYTDCNIVYKGCREETKPRLICGFGCPMRTSIIIV